MNSTYVNDLLQSLGQSALTVLLAVGALIVGWIVAMVASAIVRNILRRTGLDDRLNSIVSGEDDGAPIQIADWVSTGTQPKSIKKQVYFGGLYQKVVMLK